MKEKNAIMDNLASQPDSAGADEPLQAWKPGDDQVVAFQTRWPTIPLDSAVPAPLEGRLTPLQPWLDMLPDAVVIIDQAGLIALVNRQVEPLLGYAPADLVGHPLELLLPERFHAAHVPHRLRYVTDPRIRPMGAGLDLVGRRKDGTEVPVDISLSPLSSAGTPYVMSVIRDATERRQLERRTREALNALVAMEEALVLGTNEQGEAGAAPPVTAHATAHRLAALTHQVVDCQRVVISLLDPEAETLYPLVASDCSPEQEAAWATQLRGVPMVERLGDPARVARLHAGEALLLDLSQLPPTVASTYHGTATILAAPMRIGTRLIGMLAIHHVQVGHAYTAEEVEVVGAVARLAALVFERERLLGQREEARATALAEREANQQMDAFLSLVSHELKQPLTVLRGNLQLAQRGIRRLAAEAAALPPPDLAAKLAPLQEHLTSATQQVERQDGLMNDLLDTARVRTGYMTVHPVPANLLLLVRGAVEEQRQLAPERVIDLDLPAAEDIPVLVDARRSEQVVTNYLTNALKYSPASCPVEVGVTLEETQVRVWVRDQGPGLTPDQQQRIFERFYRVPGIEVQSGTSIGLGLGLYICQTIMEQQGGQVGVESTPGQGSTFWFTVPIGHPPEGDQRAG